MKNIKNKTTLEIHNLMLRADWEIDDVQFCAAGEYNSNYLLTTKNKPLLLRINRGSQRDDPHDPRQIVYEYRVLSYLADSNYTPRPLAVFCPVDGFESNSLFRNIDDFRYATDCFPSGFMVMEYIAGSPFHYASSYRDAATSLARIHQYSQNIGADLDRQDDPISSLLSKGEQYLRMYPDHPKTELQTYVQNKIDGLSNRSMHYPPCDMCIVNTELNSANIIAGAERCIIVDWEKAVYSFPYQDLAHFLVPTTTLWKTDFRFSPEEEEDFCRSYHQSNPIGSLNELKEGIKSFKSAVLIRALSWCYAAWYEHVQGLRLLQDEQTLRTIEMYLENLPALWEQSHA